MKKKGILLFATMWMDFESIVLSEISRRVANIVYHLYME